MWNVEWYKHCNLRKMLRGSASCQLDKSQGLVINRRKSMRFCHDVQGILATALVREGLEDCLFKREDVSSLNSPSIVIFSGGLIIGTNSEGQYKSSH